MKLNFPTRGAARQHCWAYSLPLKKISKNPDGGSMPWVVTTDDVGFTVGGKFKLVDVNGFITNSAGIVNKTNKMQADQFQKHAPDGVVIVEIDSAAGYALIEKIPGIAFVRLRLDEARYFTQVNATAEEKPAKPAKKKKANATKPAPAVEANQALEDELDGGTSQVGVEKHPRKFVTGVEYVLINKQGFFNQTYSNKSIAEKVDKERAGIYKGTATSHGVLVLDVKVPNTETELRTGERRYFKERKAYLEEQQAKANVASKPAKPAITPVDVAAQKHDETTKVLLSNLDAAVRDHQSKLDAVRKASSAVISAAAALQKHLS